MGAAEKYKYTIHIKTKHSGLCDRVRVIIIGFYLLDKLGPDAGMLVNWDKNAMQCCCDFKDLFIVPTNTAFTSSGSIKEEVSIHINCDETVTGTCDEVASYVKERNDLWELEKLISVVDGWNALHWTHHFDITYDAADGEVILTFMNMEDRYVDLDKKRYYKCLKPSEELQSRIDGFREGLGISENVIGIHIRGTDMNDIHGEEKIREEAGSLRDQMEQAVRENPGQKFFFCTEDKNIENMFLEWFDKKLIILPDKHYLVKGKRRDMENLQDAVVELWLLSMCNYDDRVKLRSNSRFTLFPALIKQRVNDDV